MLKYGKTAQNAISAMSYLAEVYDGGETRLSSRDIAERRKLPQTLVAKLLVILSQADLVESTPGPKGGYWLGRSPESIALHDIVEQFEKSSDRLHCPFGPDWCGNGDPCPLHNKLVEMDSQFSDFLECTTLDVFTKRAKISNESYDI